MEEGEQKSGCRGCGPLGTIGRRAQPRLESQESEPETDPTTVLTVPTEYGINNRRIIRELYVLVQGLRKPWRETRRLRAQHSTHTHTHHPPGH